MKLVKLQKKRQHKEKLDEIKSLKAAELEAAEKIRAEEEKKKQELEALEKARLLREAQARDKLAGKNSDN